MSTDPSDTPTEGRISAVFSTLREALRPGDAPRQPRQPSTEPSKTTSSSSLPQPATSSNHEDTFSSALRAEKQHGPSESPVSNNEGGQDHKAAFLESHRDATGHTSVMDSIMPGNQGLYAAEEPSVPRSRSDLETGKTGYKGSGSILGMLEGTTNEQSSSTASAVEDHKASSEASLSDPDRQSEENYTFGQHAEKNEAAGDRESAQPRVVRMDDNIIITSQPHGETTKQKMDELPGSVAKASQISR